MNTLVPLLIMLTMLVVSVVRLKISNVLSLAGFVPLRSGQAGSPEHTREDGAS